VKVNGQDVDQGRKERERGHLSTSVVAYWTRPNEWLYAGSRESRGLPCYALP